MVKVLLVNFPPQGLEIPPIGIASLFSNIKSVSKADIFDFNILLYHESFFKKSEWDFSEYNFWGSQEVAKQLLRSKTFSDFIGVIKKGDYDLLCFSINIHGFQLLNFLLEDIFKQVSKKLVVVGGPFCSEPELRGIQKSKYIDLFVISEGELILKDIIKLYKAKKSVKGLKNLRKTNAGNNFIAAVKIKNLNRLENPDYSLFDLNLYQCKGSMPIYFSRGCNYNCCFCRDKPIWGKNVWREPNVIMKEIAYLKKTYGANNLYCVDLDVLGDLDKLKELCLLLIKKRLNVTWSGQARVNNRTTPELLRMMRQAGCNSLCIGLESGSSRICKDMGKESPKDVKKFIKTLYNAGIKVSLALMVGYPIETWKDFSKTALFLLRNFRYVTRIPSINKFHIPPESIMFSNLGKYNIALVDGDWEVKRKNTPKTREMWYKILDVLVKILFRTERYI